MTTDRRPNWVVGLVDEILTLLEQEELSDRAEAMRRDHCGFCRWRIKDCVCAEVANV